MISVEIELIVVRFKPFRSFIASKNTNNSDC